MAQNIPAELKSAADISRFALRAAQVEKVKPVIAYWCYYWIVNQIVSKRLHQTNSQCAAYTASLMDKLEQMKAEDPTNETITDDLSASAYVEQFSLEVFERADNAVRANRVTRQTADTFLAAATFLELLSIWGPASTEITSKIKYAKYHALRILKAIRANEDPNLSNPPPDSGAGDDGGPMSADDELLPPRSGAPRREGPDAPKGRSLASKQATVEDEEDGDDGDVASTAAGYRQGAHGAYSPVVLPSAPSLFRGESNTPPPAVSAAADDPDEYYYARKGRADNAGRPAEMGQYDDDASPPPQAAEVGGEAEDEGETGIGSTAGFPGYRLPMPRARAADLPSAPPAESSFPAASAAVPPAPRAAALGGKRLPAAAAAAAAAARRPALPVADDATAYTADEEAIASASKHARWAISALNFDDVKTAVKELRQALDALGVHQ